MDELEAELFDTGVLKEEGTANDAVITTFVPPSLETRLGTVPAVTKYRQQSTIFGGLDIGSNVQEQIPGTFRSRGCKEYENDRGSSLLSAKVCETNEDVRKILRVAI